MVSSTAAKCPLDPTRRIPRFYFTRTQFVGRVRMVAAADWECQKLKVATKEGVKLLKPQIWVKQGNRDKLRRKRNGDKLTSTA